MFARRIRRIILEQSKRAHVGHIGSALSVADIVGTLYESVLRAETPRDPARDRFVLSKGHAALALYAALRLKGWIDDDTLATFCGDGSLLGVHPEHAVPGIDFSTGSLGHGLSIGAGAAMAARMDGASRRTYVLMSDAECNEGSIWEAAMFAAHHRMNNLIAIVDLNGQQALGYTRDVMNTAPLADRWRAFGWDVAEVDGHDGRALAAAMTTIGELPRVILARTIFGRGVSYMENQIAWHYLPMNDDQYRQALAETDSLA